MKRLVLAALLLVGTSAYADTLTINGAPYGDSDKNFITSGESWSVQAYNITQIGTLSGQFARTTMEYNELGYLGDQLFGHPGNADLQQDIWAVLGRGATPDFVTSHPTYMTSDVFYIPVGDFSDHNCPYGTPQPLVSPVPAVPEPSSLLLLGAGLLGLAGLSFTKKAIA